MESYPVDPTDDKETCEYCKTTISPRSGLLGKLGFTRETKIPCNNEATHKEEWGLYTFTLCAAHLYKTMMGED